MKIGLFTCGYQRGRIKTAFSDAKKFGYDYIELWGGRPHAYPYDIESCAKVIRDFICKYEMPVQIYTPEMNAYPFNIMWENDTMRNDSITYVCRAMDFAKEIGAEYTLISAGHGGFDANSNELKNRLYDGLHKILNYAEKTNQNIIYEPLSIYESNVTNSANQMLEIANDINHPHLHMMSDIVVPYIQGENMLGYLDKLKDKLVHLHIVDSDGQTESHICPGLGVLPLKTLMKELQERNYTKTMTIELVTNYINEPSFYAKMAIDHIKECLL